MAESQSSGIESYPYEKDKWAIQTYERNQGLIRNYINPLIGKAKLEDINIQFLERYYQKLLQPGSEMGSDGEEPCSLC